VGAAIGEFGALVIIKYRYLTLYISTIQINPFACVFVNRVIILSYVHEVVVLILLAVTRDALYYLLYLLNFLILIFLLRTFLGINIIVQIPSLNAFCFVIFCFLSFTTQIVLLILSF